ncbi:MAG: helix-turn-helix domain-containing protein [Candidatus Coproplasma sp.]
MNSELTTRQWALYNYLKDRGDEWTYQATCAAEIDEYNYDGNEDFKLFHDCHARHLMTADIRAINDSDVIQKIIISSAKGIKLANSEEFDRYIRKEISAAVRRLMRAKRKAEKGSRDRQGRFVFGSERDTVKAFIDSDKEVGQRLKIARLQANLSQAQVVAAMHEYDKSFDAPMLSKFEKGHCLPKKSTLSYLSKIYGVTPEYLTTGNLSDETDTNEIDGLQAVKGGI